MNDPGYTPEGWAAESLRLVVRRVRFTRARLASQSSRRRRTIHPKQVQLCLDGKLGHCYGYSFILTDIPAAERSAAELEHFHRHRAAVESA